MSIKQDIFDTEVNPAIDPHFNREMGGGRVLTEEAVILSRNKNKNGYPLSAGVPKVNGPKGDKQQYIWDGTYKIRLKRQGLMLAKAVTLMRSGRGAGSATVYAPGEEVTITWLNRKLQIALIIGGNSLDSFNKSVFGRDHLLDYGEEVIRGAISKSPEDTSEGTALPFADNQFDNPDTALDTAGDKYDENSDRVVKHPGGELFLDKFGRVISLSRQNSGHEFLTTCGKMDSGQDDVSSKKTTAEQDAYYARITSDESKPDATDLSEPLEPKALNTVQYQQIPMRGKLTNDIKKKRLVTFGVLPRFDKWKFVPVVIRSYEADSDGKVVAGDIQAVHNERGNCLYSRTITDAGDIKVFIPRHENVRVVGDSLLSVGGNVELKVKVKDRLPSGATNPNNVYHHEILTDGSVRVRTHENIITGTAKYDQKVDTDGSLTIYIKSSGGSSSDYNTGVELGADGAILVDSVKNVQILTGDGTVIGGGVSSLESMVVGDSLKTYLDKLYTSLSTWVPVPCDGGASLSTKLLTWLFWHTTHNTPTTNYLSKHNNKVN